MSIKFLAIERKKLVGGVKNEGYEDVMEEAFTRLIHDHQFKYYSARFRFVEVFKAESMKAKFLRWIKTMKATCRTQTHKARVENDRVTWHVIKCTYLKKVTGWKSAGNRI